MRKVPVLLITLALGAAGCGKGAKGDCPQIDICGGSPVGNWTVSDACLVKPVRPAQPVDVTEFTGMSAAATPTIAPPQPNPVVTTQTTSGDWCSNLVYNPDDSVSNGNLWHEAPSISKGKMIFDDTGGQRTYITQLTFTIDKGQDTTHFAHRCLIANGATAPTCAKLAAGLTDFYKATGPTVPATFSDITCTDDGNGGCDCSYAFTLQVDDQGTWDVDKSDSTVLVQDSMALTFNGQQSNSQAPMATFRTSFCQGNNMLELSGVRGGSISGIQGLRTLLLTPM
jgi:hypothetical protein